MLKPCLAILAVAALRLAYGVTAGAVCLASSAQPLADPTPPSAPAAPHVSPDQPVHHQMRTLDRHARVDMLLYIGPFGPAERSAVRSMRGLDFTAVTLSALAPLE